MVTYHKAAFVNISQHDKNFVLTKLPARVLAKISYASVRGRDDEPGAVQRVLNPRRISEIKEFTLKGGDYPNVIVLNWVSTSISFEVQGGILLIPEQARLAQLIDGQHRVAGLRAALEEQPNIGDLEIPVAIYNRLDTNECANIFLAINTEQRPAPRSLVVDLYEIASQQLIDPAAARARDIATHLRVQTELGT